MGPWCSCYLFPTSWKKLLSFFQWVHQSITNITEDSTNEKALYVTHEDICESFEGNTLLAIQAPNGTQLEVPIPEQSGLKKKYQIHLKSTDGQIYVLLVNKDPGSDHPVVEKVPPPKDIAEAIEKKPLKLLTEQ